MEYFYLFYGFGNWTCGEEGFADTAPGPGAGLASSLVLFSQVSALISPLNLSYATFPMDGQGLLVLGPMHSQHPKFSKESDSLSAHLTQEVAMLHVCA